MQLFRIILKSCIHPRSSSLLSVITPAYIILIYSRRLWQIGKARDNCLAQEEKAVMMYGTDVLHDSDNPARCSINTNKPFLIHSLCDTHYSGDSAVKCREKCKQMQRWWMSAVTNLTQATDPAKQHFMLQEILLSGFSVCSAQSCCDHKRILLEISKDAPQGSIWKPAFRNKAQSCNQAPALTSGNSTMYFKLAIS